MSLKSWKFLRFWKEDLPKVIKKLELTEGFFPPADQALTALELTAFEDVKCVILGQDPYPTKGHANGLAFSVHPSVQPLPRSLQNIFAEYRADLGHPLPRTGDLSSWARNGVLLLNTILTVREGKPLSHSGIGWEKLTEEVLQSLAGRAVFVLWGKKAQAYQDFCRSGMGSDFILTSPHPSPYSAERGFFGSKPFSRVNHMLETYLQKSPIEWKLP